MKQLFNTIVGLTLALGLLPSCGGKPNPYAKTGEDYKQAVKCFATDESLSPIMDEQAAAFTNKTHRELFPLYMSEQEAIEKLLNIDVYMAITTRRLTPNEEKSIKNKQHNPRTMALAYDAIALIVNKDNPDSVMVVDNFKKILTGEVTRWKEIYPETTLDDTIRVAFDNPRSSAVRFCNDSILRGQTMKTSGNIRAQETTRLVIDYVEKHKNAIGIIGSNWLDNNRDTTSLTYGRGIKVMAVGYRPDVAYEPLQYWIAYGKYPFIRTIYAICTDPREPRSGGDQRRFLHYLTNPGEQGQLIFFNAGFFPAQADLEERNVVLR